MEAFNDSKHKFNLDRHQYFKIQIVQKMYYVSNKKPFA
jgi:hypothetical protein